MRSQSSSFCLALFLFIIRSIATQTCSQPRSANCCENNSTKQVDSSVPLKSPTDLNCCFARNLCHYSQGCVDRGMGNWSVNNGYASVGTRNTAGGGHKYSVLESPWVNFSKPSCVEFTYFRGETPYQLQLFLAFNNDAQPRLVEDSSLVPINQNRTARFTIKPMTGKIQFRILGVGVQKTTPRPKLYHVTVLEDSCVLPDVRPLHLSTQCRQASVTPPSSSRRHSTTITTTGSTSTVGDMKSPVTSLDCDSDNNAAVIAGVTVAVIVVFIVIITVVIVYMRKRKQREGSGSDEIRPPARTQTPGLNVQPATPPTDNSSTEHTQEMTGRRDPSRSSDASNYYLTPLNVYDGLTNRNLEEHAYADMKGASACSEYYNTVSPLGCGSLSSKQAPATSNGSDYQNI